MIHRHEMKWRVSAHRGCRRFWWVMNSLSGLIKTGFRHFFLTGWLSARNAGRNSGFRPKRERSVLPVPVAGTVLKHRHDFFEQAICIGGFLKKLSV